MLNHVYYEVTAPFTAKQMFDLVNDLNSYELFMPNCKGAGVLSQQNNVLTAFIEVEKLGFSKRFITQNTLHEPFAIELDLVDGPFTYFKGKWQFDEFDGQCKVSFDLNFEFKNKILDLTFSVVFKEIMSNMVNAFTNRATQIYAS